MILDDVKTLQVIPSIDFENVELTAIKLAFVVPEPSINFMRNPSVEVNANGYYSKVVPARDNTVSSAFGRYALKFTPLDTSYSQVMIAHLPDNNEEPRLPFGSAASISFDVFGQPGESINVLVEQPSLVDFFNRSGTLAGNADDRGRYGSATYTASAGLTIQNSRLEATALTNKIRAYIIAPYGYDTIMNGTFEADVRGIYTSGAVGAWPVLMLAYNPANTGGESWIGVRLEQGLARIIYYSSGAESSLTTGAFTFVTGTQYNVRVVMNPLPGGNCNISVYVNNTLVISNYSLAAATILANLGSFSGVWLTIAGAPSGVNPYWDNLIYRNNSNILASKVVKLTKDYQRVSLSFNYVAPPTLFIEKIAPYTTNSFWTDAFLYELLPYSTTYFDGDYYGTWDGQPGQSTSSRATVQDGGKVVGLNELFVKVTALQGFGMAPLTNQSVPMVNSGGEIYQGTLSRKRQKNIICVVNGNDQQDLSRKMRAVENCFAPDALTGVGKNTKLYYQIVDPVSGVARSSLLQSPIKYQSGLEGSKNNNFQEKFVLQLEAFQTPDITEVYPDYVDLPNNAGSLTMTATLLRRYGEWNLLTGFGAGVYAKTVYIDRRGVFWYGLNNGQVIQEYAGGSTLYPALTVTGGGTVVNAFCMLPDGTMIVGGNFTGPFPYLLKCVSGGTWSQVSTTINGVVTSIAAISNSGINSYLVGGNFTLPSPYLMVIFPGFPVAPSTIVAGLNAIVRDIAVLPDLSGFYFTGDFTTSTPVAALTRIGFYNLKTGTLSALATTAGNGINNSGFALAVGPNNKLYVGGLFTQAGGMTIGFIAAWNGYNFEAVGASNNGLDAQVTELTYNSAEGMLYAVGNFLNTGIRALTPGIAKFNGSLWLPCDLAFLPGAGVNLSSISVNANYQLIGLISPASALLYPAMSTTFNYSGTAGTNPKIVCDNSTGATSIQLFQLSNYTTGKTLYIDYTVAAGEIFVIEITQTSVQVSSSYAGDKPAAIIPGSDVSSFGFQPGQNKLLFTTADRGGSNFAAYIVYRNTHWSFNGGVY